MMKTMIAEILKERIRIGQETDDNWDYGIGQCWKKAMEILTADINKSIAYFLHDCTDEEFYWLSEIFEDIAEQAQSRELVAALRNRLAAVTPQNYHQESFQSEHMRKWVDYAYYMQRVGMEIDYADGVTEAMLYNAEAARHEKGGTNDENNDCGNPEGADPHRSGDR